jgi:hypothetical protein
VRNLLQTVRSWLGGGKARKPEPVPDPRPYGSRFRDAGGKPTPEALDDEQAVQEFLDEQERKRDEEMEQPPPRRYEP